jgi:hypothetical protein
MPNRRGTPAFLLKVAISKNLSFSHKAFIRMQAYSYTFKWLTAFKISAYNLPSLFTGHAYITDRGFRPGQVVPVEGESQ